MSKSGTRGSSIYTVPSLQHSDFRRDLGLAEMTEFLYGREDEGSYLMWEDSASGA
jgi:hypothetical protein